MDISEIRQYGLLPEERHPWELARLEVVFCLICKEFRKPQEIPLTILDIGCGDTFIIEELSRRLPLSKIVAVDAAFNDELLSLFNKQHKDKQIELYKSLNNIEFHKVKVDIVLLLDVLEHIENDTEFLDELLGNDYIGPDTQFLITVPAFQCLYSAHDVFLKHYRRYSNRTLKKCLIRSGLEIRRLGYFFFSLLFPRMLQVVLQKFSKTCIVESEKGIGAWNPHRVIDSCIIKLLIADFKIADVIQRFGIKLVGLSNYSICKKRLS